MAVSGSTDFELDVSDYIEEAFERCGLEVRTGYDLKTAKRSLNLMFADWANRGLNQWTITQRTQALTQGTSSYTLGADVIDVLSMVIQRSNSDLAMSKISRDTYINIPSKTTQSRPTQFFVDRQVTPVIKIWPTPENNTDVVKFDRLTRIEDVDSATDTVDIPFRFYPCLTAGLAYYISMKRNPQMMPMLKSVYEEEMQRAMDEDRDRASLRISPSYDYYRA